MFLLLAMACLTCIVHAQGFLKANDKIIVDGKGKKIILRGMGLGGWMLQEGYMFRMTNLGQQYRIREKITGLVGEEKATQFYNAWLRNHTSKADIDSLAAWGFNSVRLPMHYRLFTLPVEEEPVKGGHTWEQKGFDLVDSLLNWCSRNNLYLFLDMHAAPGGQGNDLPISDRDPSKPSLWQSEANRQKMVALWKKLAARYANEKWIGGYDIINEPNWGFEDENDKRGTAEKKNQPLRELMMEITKAIREVDQNHIIIIEGNGFGNNYNGVLPTWDPNLVLSFHKYGNFNTENAIRNFLDLRERYNIPLWLGESGENSNTWFTGAIQLVESKDIGWAWWQEKKMGINNPLEIRQPGNYELLLNYWSGKGAKPSADDAWTILSELIDNIKIRNNILHPDVIDAMFRQVGTTETKPFRNFILDLSLTIPAVDYDLGRQRYAYYDKDSASYQYTPGVNTRGNRGWSYRNDGVDVSKDSAGYFVFSIEDGEWLQYTINSRKKGSYYISFTTTGNDGIISLNINDKKQVENYLIDSSEGEHVWKSTRSRKIKLDKGINRIIVRAEKGGFNLQAILISRDPQNSTKP